ncbi:MAG: Ig-like domain repeat protein [Xanthomonadales bacterium]|nr:Ig-like domain repeat protein [Xanthomonadales bacterium]
MTDTHPTSLRGLPPARSWGRRLASSASAGALALLISGFALATDNPWREQAEARPKVAAPKGSPGITMTLTDDNGGSLQIGESVTVTANVPGSLGGGDFDLWACPDQSLLPRANGASGTCIGPNIQSQTGDSTTFTLDSRYNSACNWFIVVHDYPSGGHSTWVGPLLGISNCGNSLPGTPAPPAAPSVAPATAQVTVAWTAPADGGSAITGYTVQQSTNSGGSWSDSVGACAPATTESSTALSCVASPLTGGTNYVFRVRAINATGSGAYSPASATATPPAISPPDAPTAATATAGNQSAAVSWTAPGNDGGAAISGYTVTGTPSGSCTATAPATTCTVNGLSNDLSYTFTVVATNSAGDSPASAASASVSPQRAASTTAITGTTASLNSGTRARTNESFSVSFTVSSSDATGVANGGTVTVEAQTSGGTVVGSCSAATTAGAGSCSLSGLKPSDSVARLVASLAQTPRLLASQSSPFAFDVTRSNTTSTLTSNSPSVFGQDIVLDATFSATAPGANPVTGTARFVRQPGNVTIVEVPIVPGTGGAPSTASTTISTDPAVAGSPYTYNVAILDNTDFIGSNGSRQHTVNRASTAVTVTSIAPAVGPDIQVNETVTVSASVAAVAPGDGTPGGTVQVRGTGGDAASTTGCDITLSAGAGSCDLSFSTKGGATLVFSYVESANFAASSSNQAVTVLGLPVTLSLTPPASSPYFGDSYAVNYSLTGGAGSFEGAVSLSAAGPTAATATCVSNSAPANNTGVCTFAGGQDIGSYTLSGDYAGDTQDLAANATGAVTIQAATTELTVSTSPTSSAAGQDVTLAVELTRTNGSGPLDGQINITASGLTNGGVASSGCTLNLSTQASPFTGDCTRAFTLFGDNQVVTAVFVPSSSNFAGDTVTTTHDVTSALTTPNIGAVTPFAPQVGDQISFPFSIDGCVGDCDGDVRVSVGFGAPVVFTAPVACTFNRVTGEGDCTAPASSFQAFGEYTLQLEFVPDNASVNDAASSDSVLANVARRDTFVSIGAAVDPVQAGLPATFNVTVSNDGGDFFAPATIPDGTARICSSADCAGGDLCTSPIVLTGTAGDTTGSCQITFNDVTTRTLHFVYAGNTHFAGASDSTPFQTTPRDTTLAITRVSSFTSGTSPAANALVGERVTVSFDVGGGAGNIDGSVTVTATGPGAITETCGAITVNALNGEGACTFRVSDGNGLEQAGAWSFSAAFAPSVGSNEAASSTGAGAASINIQQASTQLVLSSSPAPSVFGQPFTLIATVTAVAPAEGYPTGDVNFFDGESNAIGVVTLTPTATPGVSTAQIANLTRNVQLPNGWRFVAATITNPNFAGANDFGYDHLVNRDSQTIEITAPASLPFAPSGSFNVSAVALADFTAAASGQPVTISVGPASVCTGGGTSTAGSSISISIVAGGTCEVSASVAQSQNYLAATASADVVITPIDQFITFNSLPIRPAGSAPFTVSATSDSGLPVSFASGTPTVCTVSGNTVSYVAPGVCEVVASQAGNSSYNPADDEIRDFVYIAIEIEGDAIDGTVDENYFVSFNATSDGSANLPYTYSFTGDTVPGVTLNAVTGAFSGIPTTAGTYTFTITATDSSVAGPDRVGAPYSGSREYTITIAKAPQAITGFAAAPTSLVYLGTPATLSATGGDSGNPVVFSSLTPTICSVATNQVTPLLAGTCTVAADQAGNDDYEAAPQVTLNITVAKAEQAALTAAAAPTTVAYLETSALSVTGGTTGGTVTYAVTAGPSFCSVSGSTLTASAADGTCTVTATMAGDDNYLPVSDTVDVSTIKAQQAGFTVDADPSTIAFNGTSALSTTGGNGSGAVSYAISAESVVSGTNVCSLSGSTITGTGIGTCDVTATKAGDANYEPSTDVVVITVDKANQTLTFVTPAPGPLTVGGPVANVQASASSGLTVSYGVAAGSTTICDVNSSNGGLTLFTAGTCVLTANQAGNPFYNAAPEVTQSVIIEQAQPSISLVGSGSPTSPGDSVTFTATVSAGFSPTGTVTFRNNGVNIAGCIAVPLSGLTAQCVTTALPQGSHPITAVYNGDLNNLTATSNTVTQVVLTGTTITLSGSNLAEARFGQVVSVGFTVSGGVAPNEGLVTVTASRPGSTVTCTAAAATGSCSLSGLVTTGPALLDGYTVSAAYAGDANDGSSSTAASQTLNVLRSNTNTLLTIAPATSSPFGQGFTLTATVTAVAPGSGVPPGTIVFLRDGESIGEVSLSGAGVAVFNVPAGLPVGNYVYRAEYAQTTNYLQSFENRNYAITAKATTTTITGSSVNPSALGASVSFSYAVATSPSDTTPTGTVALTASTGETCSASVAAGSCALTFNTAGARTVTAVYGGDSVHATSTSAAFAHSVDRGTQAALIASATPSAIQFGGTSTLATTGGTGTGAVSFAVTTGGSVCSVSGSTLTGTGVGTCTVTATKAGDVNYEPTSATVEVTVSRAPQAALVVTATPDSIVFQGTSTLAATGGTGTGAVSFAVTGGTGTCSIAGSTLTGTGVGTCVVTATKSGGDNYLDQTGTVTVTVAQAPQTITFGANPGPLTFAGTSGSVSATASSGLPVSFSTASAGICSVDSGTGAITILGAGNCVVAANQAGNANYLAAPEVTQTVVINKAQQAALSATATPQTIVFQGTSTLAATGGSGTGTEITFAVTGGTGTCTISGSTLTGTGVGTCVVTATKAGDANYEPQTGTVTVTVNQAPQTITFGANPGPLTFGGASGTVSATASSGLPVSFGTSSPTVCSVNASSGAITVLTAGNCVVTGNQAGNANYLAAPQVTQIVVINPGTQAALVVTATPNPVIAGQTSALSTTGGSGTGAVTYAVTAGGASCTVSGSTLTAVAQGSCTVTATKAGDGNYLPQTGTVVVTVNPATVDLSIVKTGRYITNGVVWTLNVGNTGPGVANGATVIDNLPTSVTGATWTCTGTAGGTCSVASGSGSINTNVNLPVGGGAVFTITATLVNPNAATVVNTASVVAPMGITDTNAANNTSTLDLTVALFGDGFEGSGSAFGSFEAKASLSTLQIDGAAVEQQLHGIEARDVGVYQIDGSELRVQAREINGLVEVRLIQREAKGLWSSTRWMELWPGDSVRLDYSKAGSALQTRLAVGM